MIGYERLAEHLIQDRMTRYREQADVARARRSVVRPAWAPELRSRLAAALTSLAARLEPAHEIV